MVVGVDIGGTLAKIAYFAPNNPDKNTETFGAVPSIKFDDTKWLHFRYFRTAEINDLISFLKPLCEHDTLCLTGGGSHKFYDLLKKDVTEDVKRYDEIDSAVHGLIYILEHSSNPEAPQQPCAEYDMSSNQKRYVSKIDYPFLLVNIGSGVGCIKVESNSLYARCSGTCIGGGTTLGLSQLYFPISSFQELVELSEKGTECLDLTVGDLTGDSVQHSQPSLPPDLLASSFGRLHQDGHAVTITKEDFAYSSIRMVSYNLGYLGYLLASLHSCKTILFGGKYVSDHAVTMRTITEGVLFSQIVETSHESGYAEVIRNFQKCSPENSYIKACFLTHDGFLGAVGTIAQYTRAGNA